MNYLLSLVIFVTVGCSTIPKNDPKESEPVDSPVESSNRLKLPTSEYYLAVNVSESGKKGKEEHFNFKHEMSEQIEMGKAPYICFVEAFKAKHDPKEEIFENYKGSTFEIRCQSNQAETGFGLVVFCGSTYFEVSFMSLYDWTPLKDKKPAKAFTLGAQCKKNPNYGSN